MRPGRVQFPVAGRLDGLALNLSIDALQALQYLFVEAANPTHRKHGRQYPLSVSARIRRPDRVLVPHLGSAHRCLSDSSPDLLRHTVVAMKLVEPVLDVTKRALCNRHYVVRIFESTRPRLLENRPKSYCSCG